MFQMMNGECLIYYSVGKNSYTLLKINGSDVSEIIFSVSLSPPSLRMWWVFHEFGLFIGVLFLSVNK
jgi:hypothetical protein